jgi:hypothetical protein
MKTRGSGNKWSASLPRYSTPRERSTGTHWIGGGMGPAAGKNVVVKGKISARTIESNLDSLVVQPVAKSLYGLSYSTSYVYKESLSKCSPPSKTK